MQHTIWQSFGADSAGEVRAQGTIAILGFVLIGMSIPALGGTAALAVVPLLLGAIMLAISLGTWARSGPAGDAAARALHGSELHRSDPHGSEFETIQDLQWKISEREAQYRDLLDRQDQVIARSDASGLLTFVNDAFCKTFGVGRDEVLGQPLSLPIIDCETPPGQETELAQEAALAKRAGKRMTARRKGTRRTRVVELETVSGPRWFVWDDFILPDETGEGSEVQSIGRDVTEQRATEISLAQARDRALRANQAKSRFLASVSHEIRTPMNGVLGMTGLLMDTGLTAEQSTYARAIAASAKTLLGMIDEVLDFSKIEAGKMELRPGPFDVADSMQGVVELLGARARDKGLEIGWFVAPDLPKTVIGDEMRVRQILMNLVGNAIKFTDEGGVTLTARQVAGPGPGDAPLVRFDIIDTGPGIEPEALERIFAEFEQAGQGRAPRKSGTGLGLAISRKLTKAMGGNIRVSSEPGSGTTFTVELPLEVQADTEMVGAAMPQPAPNEHVLVLLSGDTEAHALCELVTAMGAKATRVDEAEVQDCARCAAATGSPFTAMLTDTANAALAASAALPFLAKVPGRDTPRAVVMIDPRERGRYQSIARHGFTGYVLRPARPFSVLTQLFAPADEASARQQDSASAANAAENSGTAARQSRQHPTHGLSVLLAEDNEINALLARTILERFGNTVTRARNGAEAIEHARCALEAEKGFDLVLMDIHMPGMDGTESAARIRALYPHGAESGLGRPPIVALTANAHPDDRAAYLAAGLDDYLAKPFEKNDLVDLLARLWPARDASRAGAA